MLNRLTPGAPVTTRESSETAAATSDVGGVAAGDDAREELEGQVGEGAVRGGGGGGGEAARAAPGVDIYIYLARKRI